MKDHQDNLTFHDRAAQQAAAAVADLFDDLAAQGLPAEAVMAGIHAGVIARMVWAIGGPATVARMVNAADRIEHLPSASHVKLMAAQPASRA